MTGRPVESSGRPPTRRETSSARRSLREAPKKRRKKKRPEKLRTDPVPPPVDPARLAPERPHALLRGKPDTAGRLHQVQYSDVAAYRNTGKEGDEPPIVGTDEANPDRLLGPVAIQHFRSVASEGEPMPGEDIAEIRQRLDTEVNLNSKNVERKGLVLGYVLGDIMDIVEDAGYTIPEPTVRPYSDMWSMDKPTDTTSQGFLLSFPMEAGVLPTAVSNVMLHLSFRPSGKKDKYIVNADLVELDEEE